MVQLLLFVAAGLKIQYFVHKHHFVSKRTISKKAWSLGGPLKICISNSVVSGFSSHKAYKCRNLFLKEEFRVCNAVVSHSVQPQFYPPN